MNRDIFKMIKAIIFDIDNTLVDFMKVKRVAVEAAVEAMIDAGLKMPKEEMVDKIHKAYGEEGIEDQHIFDKVLQQEFGHIDYRILASGIIGYRKAKEGTMNLYPHVHLTLTTLAKMGIKMIIVTDAPRLPVWMRICALELQHYFERVLSYEDTGEKKPSPKPFRMALDILKVKPEETLMVGDWAERDVVGAKKMGIKTAFARYGDRFGTKDSGADYDLNDILELVDIVQKENKK
ncbi:MAG TPA: HAD-IA family hydrolase [bacterium]|nr:HAD-IA family hydrolase [bacterium]